jgi:hypothetical protein
MRQHIPHQQHLRLIKNLCDQPVRVALDIENNQPAHRIGCREFPPNIRQTSPRSPLRNAVQRIKRRVQLRMNTAGQQELLPTDDVHSTPCSEIIRNLRISQSSEASGELTRSPKNNSPTAKSNNS